MSEATVNAGGATEARDPRDLAGDGPARRGRAARTPGAGPHRHRHPGRRRRPADGAARLARRGVRARARAERRLSRSGRARSWSARPTSRTSGSSLGSTATVRPAVDEQPGVRLEVVGTYAPRDDRVVAGPAAGRHLERLRGPDPSAAHDAWLTTEETFVDGPILPERPRRPVPWCARGTTGVDEVLALGDQVREMSDDVRAAGRDLHVLTDLDAVTDDVRAQTGQAHRTVPLLMAPMAVLTLFVLWLVLARRDRAAARGGRRRPAPRPRAGRSGRPAAGRAAPRPPGGRRAGCRRRAARRVRWPGHCCPVRRRSRRVPGS